MSKRILLQIAIVILSFFPRRLRFVLSIHMSAFGYQKENTYLDSCQVLGVNLWQMQKNKNTHKKLVQYFHFNETMLARG